MYEVMEREKMKRLIRQGYGDKSLVWLLNLDCRTVNK